MARIGIDGHVLTGRFQGTRTTLTSLLRSTGPKLMSRGYELVVYADDVDDARTLLGVEDFEYRPLGRCGSIKRLFTILPKLFRRDAIDLGVFQYIAPVKGRHIVFIHDVLPMSHPHLFPWTMRFRMRIFCSLAIRRAAMVVAVSEFTRAEVKRLYRISDDRLRLVLNGPSFSPGIFARGRAPSTERYVLCIGRIEPRKNVRLLVEAFLGANLLDVQLIVVGSFDNGYDWQIPADPRISWRQGVSDDALIDLYRGAALMVYPSEAEGFGMPLLDGLLFGIPMIASNLTAMAEIANGVAETFDPTAPEAEAWLARRIAAHFNDRPVPAPDAAQRATLAGRFNWDRAADAFLEAVDTVEANRR